MSQFGNQGSTPGQSPYGAPNNPYGSPNPQAGGSKTVYTRRKQKKPANVGAIVGIVLGILGVMVLCCVGSCCGFWYWDVNNTENEIADQIRNSPELREQIGELKSLKTQMTESNNHPDMDVMIYEARGTEGTADVIISWTVDDDFNVNISWERVRDRQGIERPMTLR